LRGALQGEQYQIDVLARLDRARDDDVGTRGFAVRQIFPVSVDFRRRVGAGAANGDSVCRHCEIRREIVGRRLRHAEGAGIGAEVSKDAQTVISQGVGLMEFRAQQKGEVVHDVE
jgi:hypothetical protein